ncbi:PIN domain-containing protein [Cyanobacterium aponinum]|uniref:PIN domain-containing protein n=1 Tax=Cyanobacterium aponinum TaxID=379064 RepID=UPI001F4DE333|nr:PIN domain-containing protein [Cyanobacterium aponinum]
MIILDTNIISELMKGDRTDKNVYNWIVNQEIKSLYITTISQAEILLGIAILPEKKDEYN